ncbi:hypothetical protein [Aquimarina algiphila]|uniref:Uncharacterized protein n=1 Tax=Aquimarina algiphila TaxID=2047982 RepID=A0A554VBJ7_9FLAO|nr:hypothetical protein [Aquimarina algiphila]TSE03934.1 hypothetical protein FOF46_28125 [Aquimarina algiphila]
MPLKKSFVDDNGNEMQFFINTDNNLYVEIKNEDYPDRPNFIVLERDDVEEMILLLTDELNKKV